MPGLRPSPLVGGYYWFPAEVAGRATWAVVTCHDLGFDAEVGHVDLWPSVVDRLAASWGRGAGALRRLLTDHYTGLPRGRVTRPGRGYLILHGDDAPVPDWPERVLVGFGLDRRSVSVLYDEHERMLGEDRRRLSEALGVTGEPRWG